MSKTCLNCDAMQKLAIARENAKSREDILKAKRKDLDQELGELGATPSERRREVSDEYVRVLRSIDWVRSRQKTLADKMQDLAIKGQGKLFDDGELDALTRVEPTDAELFQAAQDDEGDDGAVVGEPGPSRKPGRPRPETPDPSKGDGVDEHLAASVNELDLAEYIKGKLINAGLTTVGRVAQVIDSEKDLQDEANISRDQAILAQKAVAKYRRQHRRASMEAEDAA